MHQSERRLTVDDVRLLVAASMAALAKLNTFCPEAAETLLLKQALKKIAGTEVAEA
jgi:hypothetical protein